ncbi:hypothetical protein NDU88_001325 [Pleurodeles waltl]|uniref:Uncharacterized protein n=1 Tax=Pleurodeles waltl TaxID=8319 RepID=A0AAV7LXA9_PLEWA|nr:hypothetical protein NDU88_001325 [Pleurodeles waltl]
MGKEGSTRSGHQTKMDRFTAVGLGGPLPDQDTGLHEPQGPTGAQILAAIEATCTELLAQIDTVSIEVNLLRVDLKKVVEHSLEME